MYIDRYICDYEWLWLWLWLWLYIVIDVGADFLNWPKPQVANHKLEYYAKGPWHDHENGLVEVLHLAGKQGNGRKNNVFFLNLHG